MGRRQWCLLLGSIPSRSTIQRRIEHESNAVGFQPTEGGAIPTSALHTSKKNKQTYNRGI